MHHQRPDSVEILLRLTRAYRRIGLYDEALELLYGAAKTGSIAVSLTLARAQIQMQVGSYQAAHATLNQAIAAGGGASPPLVVSRRAPRRSALG